MDGLAKLRWQCRRGVKELDVLLLGYLEQGYGQADEGERALFVQLLGLEDDELLGVLLGDGAVGEMQGLVSKIQGVAEQSNWL